MNVLEELDGPFPFTGRDLEPAKLNAGVRRTLAHFHRWREANRQTIAAHVDRHTAHLRAIRAEHRSPPVLARLSPGRRRTAERLRMRREAVHFTAFNMAELLPPARIDALVEHARDRIGPTPDPLAGLGAHPGTDGAVAWLERRLPVLRGLPETRWLAERLDRLHHALPEAVVRAGGMGKVIRTLAGVLLIGVYDTLDAEPAEARRHLARVLPGAYAYGAAYAIVDDTLHDLPGRHVSERDRARYHRLIRHGLATGEPVDAAELPDHPLADELYDLQGLLREHYPFDRHRQLYHAAEAMYLAQDRDAARRLDAPPAELTALYPDVFVKAGVSRIIANLLGRRAPDEGFYARCVHIAFLSQLRDDLIDRDEDRRAGRLTPFTFPVAQADTDPLYDLFAYHAYVVEEVFGGDPGVADAFSHYSAARLAACLGTGDRVAGLLRDYAVTGEIAEFLRTACDLPERARRGLDAADQRLKRQADRLLGERRPTGVDCRTFVADRLPYIEEVTGRYCRVGEPGNRLDEIVAYAMSGAGKRLRPALGLMLAESLGVDPAPVEPALAACELFHTASLLFDDLPAHDDATLRRGRPAAHLVFDEADVQLAAISMISSGFGLLSRLGAHYPPQRVNEVIGYLGAVLGPERLCLGQHLDLALSRREAPASVADIVRMYALKTSTALEAALVPLMMVLDRPQPEIDLLKGYAHHAGIVFQIRDDILDATAAAEVLGKDAGNDTGKANLVRTHGLATAERLLAEHLAEALACCARLPFDTGLLACAVRHFATRRR